MIESFGRINAKLAVLSVVARCAILASAVFLTALIALPIGYARHELLGLAAVGLAAAVCGTCSLVALVLATRWHGTPNGITGALAGSLVGMFPPLVVGVALQHSGSPLAAAGAFGWIVVFYLATLTVKTLLVAPAMNRPASAVASVAANSASKAGA